MEKLSTIILAAGKGTRMKSDLPKVLHKIDNKELVKYVIKQAEDLNSKPIVLVVGHKHELIREATAEYNVSYALQAEQLGTGHAVMMTKDELEDATGNVLILCGDVPLLRSQTLKSMLENHLAEKADCTVLTAHFDDPTGYGRIIKNPEGNIERIVEQKDGNPEELSVKEINSGVYLVNKKLLFNALEDVKADNAQAEYYLTDIIKILKKQGKNLRTYLLEDNREIYGINTIEQLKTAEGYLKDLI